MSGGPQLFRHRNGIARDPGCRRPAMEKILARRQGQGTFPRNRSHRGTPERRDTVSNHMRRLPASLTLLSNVGRCRRFTKLRRAADTSFYFRNTGKRTSMMSSLISPARVSQTASQPRLTHFLTTASPGPAPVPRQLWSCDGHLPRQALTEIAAGQQNVARCIPSEATVRLRWRRRSTRISFPQQNSWTIKTVDS